jgi:hypothetical protein
MKAAAGFAFAISLVGVSLADATESAEPPTHPYRHVHCHHHRGPAAPNTATARPPAAPAPAAARPAISPPVQNESDGLSRDPEDCNMGCVDTTD